MYLQMVDILKNENTSMKREIEGLKVEIEDLKKSSASNIHGLSDFVKREIDNLKGEIVNYLSEVKTDVNKNINGKFVEFKTQKVDTLKTGNASTSGSDQKYATYSEISQK